MCFCKASVVCLFHVMKWESPMLPLPRGAKVQHDLMKGCTRAETRLPAVSKHYTIFPRDNIFTTTV